MYTLMYKHIDQIYNTRILVRVIMTIVVVVVFIFFATLLARFFSSQIIIDVMYITLYVSSAHV